MIGLCVLRGILAGSALFVTGSLECPDALLEMEYFPESNCDVENTDTADGSSHPSGSDYALQAIHSRLAGGVEEKVIISPVAQDSQSTLRDPR